jgi:uncharacterized membrane protein
MAAGPAPEPAAPPRTPSAAVLALACLAAGALLGLLLYSSLFLGAAQSHDAVIYPRALWGLWHGAPVNSVYPIHSLAIHGHLVYYALIPLDALLPASLALIVAQGAALAATLWLLARAFGRVGGPRAAYLGWFLALVGTPLLVNPFVFDARPEVIGVPFALAALLRAEERGGFDLRAIALLLVAPLTRVEWSLVVGAALVLVPRGLPNDVGRRWRWGAAALAGAYFALYWGVIRGWLGGEVALARTHNALEVLVVRPEWDTSAIVWSELAVQKALALGLIATAMGGLSLRGWRWLGSGALGFGFLLLMTKHYEQTLLLHYPLFAAPALLTAGVAGARRWWPTAQGRPAAVALALVLALASFVVGSAAPGGRAYRGPETFNLAALVGEPAPDSFGANALAAHALLARVPAAASISAPYLFAAPLAERVDIWSNIELRRSLTEDDALPTDLEWIALLPQDWSGMGRVLVNRHGYRFVGAVDRFLALFARADVFAALPDAERAAVWEALSWPAGGACPVEALVCEPAGLRLCAGSVDAPRAGDVVAERTGPGDPGLAGRSLAVGLARGSDAGWLGAYHGLVRLTDLPVGRAMPLHPLGALPDGDTELIVIADDGAVVCGGH